MANQNYFPAKEGSLVLWFDNFTTKLALYAVALGLLPADITDITAKITEAKTSIDDANNAKQTLKHLESAKKAKKGDTIDYLRGKIARMKTEAGYTEAIGRDLGIVSSSDTIDPHTYKPTITAKAFPKYIEVGFVKKGIDAVDIYKRIKGEVEWKFLARSTHSPHHDNTDLAHAGTPEVREYMAIGLIGDEEVGLESDVVTAIYDGGK